MTRTRGGWAGGPGWRTGDERAKPRGPLESAEELDARRMRGARRRRTRSRRRRVWATLGSALALAGGAGLWLGLRAHRSSEQLTAEREAERRTEQSFDLTRETNRMLLELWRMEDVERQRGLPVP